MELTTPTVHPVNTYYVELSHWFEPYSHTLKLWIDPYDPVFVVGKMDHHHSLHKPMQSYAEEDVGIVSDHQGLISSSKPERQSELLEPKVLSLFGLGIDKNLYLHQLQPVS
jgi:hypothetical protein